ncbi:MAG: TMEM175 family protein [Candidatus Paceibacterota bacterium]
MKANRLEQLSDGIFAIVMTILVFELRVPVLEIGATNADLLEALISLSPFVLSYVLSFAMLFTYWRAHHFFISVYAKNIDMTLTNINALFFLFVGVVPFTTSLLGRVSNLELPIILFSLNVILIGLCLYAMRNYVFQSPHIKNIEVNHAEIMRGTVRTLVPVFFALIAIPLCFYSKGFALTLLTLAILFNFSHTSTRLFSKFIK